MASQSALNTLSGIGSGDHLCYLYESDEQHRTVITRYLREGLEQRQRVMYVADAHSPETIADYLRADGLDPEPYLASGQLVITRTADAHMAGGAFDPQAMIEYLRAETERALADGYTALRTTGEMTWALGAVPGGERLIEYEAALNQFFDANKIAGLCQYDMRRFDVSALLDVLRTHPLVVAGTDLYDNFLYASTIGADGEGESAVRFRQWLDILAERKRALDEAAAEHEFTTAVLDTAGVLVLVIDTDGHIVRWNRFAEESSGYSLDEVRGRPFWETFLLAEETERVRAWFAQLAGGQAPVGGQNFWVMKDGTRRWIEWSNTVLHGTDGNVRHIIAVGIDRTARREAEMALEQMSVYNRSLIEASLDPLVTIARDGKITDVNSATELVTGRTRQQLIGTDFSDYFTDPAQARAGYQQVFRDGQVTDYRLEIVRRDGHTTPVLYNASVYRDESGEVVGVFAAARDISDRLAAEVVLQRVSAYNRSLIEASLDPLVTIARDGRITDVNSATERVTGRPREQLIGTDFSDYFTEPEKARAGYQQVFRDGLVTDYELEIVSREGRATPVLYSATVYRDNTGEVAGVFAAARDVSERKQQESEILALNAALERRAADLAEANRELARANADLTRLNEEMTSFTYSVSHDLSSPLVSLQGMAGLLLRDYADKLDEDGVHRLQRLQANVTRMETLVGDLLELSRIGRVSGRVALLEISDVVRQSLESLAEMIAEAGMTVSVSGAGGVRVRGDEMRLQQVLVNLVANAVKYRGEQEQPRLEIGWESLDDQVRVWVADNGVGIAPEFHQAVFRPFQRLPETRHTAGTGMGLAIVRRIVEHHGGRVWVESEPGHGSQFQLTLPKAGADDD